MNTLLIINQQNYEIIQEKTFNQKSLVNNTKDYNSIIYSSILEIVKDLDSINSNLSDHYILKIDGGKLVIYRKGNETKLGIIIISEKGSIKRANLVELSKVYMQGIESNFMKNALGDVANLKKNNLQLFNTKEFTIQAIEELTIKFIESLRKNKLYAKFIYYNYNANVISSISYKKSKLESTSVILYNSNKEYDKIVEPKDTMLQKSTIKEKELNIELEKKANPPTGKKIFIKKFNSAKSEIIKKKNITKYFGSNFFIEKYFLTKNTMMHYLFNNIFLESPSKDQNKDNFVFPINTDNEHLLLYVLDIYDKAQSLFAVSKTSSQEYLDIVNYIEINLNKPEVMLMKSKLVLIKFKSLFILINLEIYEDKNIWSSINSNTNFYKEIENLFTIVFNESYNE